MSDYRELIAEAREFATWIEPSQGATSDLMLRLADALEAAERDKREAQAEALEAAAEIARRYNKGYSQHPHDYIVHKTQATIAATIAERAAEIRKGRA